MYVQMVQNMAHNGSMDSLLMHVHRVLRVLIRHLQHAHTLLSEQEQQQQLQQEEHDVATNSTPPAAPAAPHTPAAAAAAIAPAAAAAAAAVDADAPELAVSCSSAQQCSVMSESAVLLVIEGMQLLAAMSEQSDNELRYDSLLAYDQFAFLLHKQLMLLQSHPDLHDRRSSVVQTSAQLLMQLLCWQLQQAAQHSTPPGGVDASVWQDVLYGIGDQAAQALYADFIDRCSGVRQLIQRRLLPRTLRAQTAAAETHQQLLAALHMI
jgi:hypothetical protein